MSIRTSLLALASIAMLATAALAPTDAFAGHGHGYGVFMAKHSGGGYLPPCGRVGCNMKQ
jgi:hypothetical protein